MERLLEAIRLKGEGFTYAEVAGKLGISAPRVYQILMPSASIRTAVLARARHHCESCHHLAPRLQLHHRSYSITPSAYNAPENLQALCAPCHGRSHPKNLKRMMEAVRRHPFWPAQKTHDADTCGCDGCRFGRGEILYNGMTIGEWRARCAMRAAKRAQRDSRRTLALPEW